MAKKKKKAPCDTIPVQRPDMRTGLLDSLSLGKPAYIYVGGCPLDMVEYGTKCVGKFWRYRATRSGHHVLELTLQTIELFWGEKDDGLLEYT